MDYSAFKQVVSENGWTLAALRCDAPPPPELFALMDDLGLDVFEQFVLRYERECSTWN